MLSSEAKYQQYKFNNLGNTVIAWKAFISTDQQKTMGMECDDIATVDTHLMKGDTAPPKKSWKTDNVSLLIEETRESKANAYVAVESKKIGK